MPTLCQTTAVSISPFAAASARSPEDPARPTRRFGEMLTAAPQLGPEESKPERKRFQFQPVVESCKETPHIHHSYLGLLLQKSVQLW